MANGAPFSTPTRKRKNRPVKNDGVDRGQRCRQKRKDLRKWVAHASRVLVLASRRNDLVFHEGDELQAIHTLKVKSELVRYVRGDSNRPFYS